MHLSGYFRAAGAGNPALATQHQYANWRFGSPIPGNDRPDWSTAPWIWIPQTAAARSDTVEDSLGMAAQLDEQIKRLIGNYDGEWTTTLKDPEKLKRFRQMIKEEGGPS